MPLERFRVAVGSPRRHARWLVALSGGSDSIALLYLALEWHFRERPDITIAAAHLNHGLRGSRALLDAEFCREMTLLENIPFHHSVIDVRKIAARDRISIETAARQARLEFLSQLATKHSYDTVLTAHHRDDQVETILARVLRGSGPRGKAGIPHRRPLTCGSDVDLLRPCLEIEREELALFRSERGLACREDETNLLLDVERNRLRHELLPRLRTALHPDLDSWILKLGRGAARVEEERREALRDLEERWVLRSKITPEEFHPRIVGGGAHFSIPPAWCRALARHPGAASTLLQAIWNGEIERCLPQLSRSISGPMRRLPGELRSAHHREWLRFLEGSGRGTSIDLPGGVSLERSGGWVHLIGLLERPGAAPQSLPLPQTIGTGSMRTELRWRGARVELGPERSHLPGALVACVPTDVPICLRGARPGDRMALPGGTQRVGELLRKAGIPARWRPEFPVIAIEAAARVAALSRDTARLRPPPLVQWVPGARVVPTIGPHAWVTIVPETGDGNDAIAHFLRLGAGSPPIESSLMEG